MFTIYGGKTEFSQWDLNQRVVNPDMCDCEQVIFTMSNGRVGISRAYEYEGQMVADVPNHLLQYSGNVMVDLGQGADQRIEEKTFFTVVECGKPEGYVCTPNRNLAKKYLETVTQELTEAEKAQVRKNIGAGEGGGSGGVKTVNGQHPDENGDITLEMPEGGGGVAVIDFGEENAGNLLFSVMTGANEVELPDAVTLANNVDAAIKEGKSLYVSVGIEGNVITVPVGYELDVEKNMVRSLQFTVQMAMDSHILLVVIVGFQITSSGGYIYTGGKATIKKL